MKFKRDNKGRFTSKRFNIALFLGIVGVVYFLVWFIPLVRQVNAYDPSVTATTTEYVDMTPEKIRKVQDKLLGELSTGCETKGVTEPDAAIILDTNNQMSLGSFMFQIKTVQYYMKSLNGETVSRHDAILLALDPVKSRELAREIIFEANGLDNNWTNCSIKFQLSKEVETIKAFMKL